MAPGLSLPAVPPSTPQEELESYPLSAIVRCDTVIPPGQSCSLLLLVCQEPERTQPDVHFFQGLRLGVSERGSGPQTETLRIPDPELKLGGVRSRTSNGAGPLRPGARCTAKAGSGPAEGA